MFRSVTAAVNLDFTEIEVNFNGKTCKANNLTINRLNDLKRDSLFQWMMNREQKKQIQCILRAQTVKCYCDDAEGFCWDYGEFMNAVYMISRDRTTATIPKSIGNGDTRAHTNTECVLTALYESIDFPWLLFSWKTSIYMGRDHKVIDYVPPATASVYNNTFIPKNITFDVGKARDRGEVDMEFTDKYPFLVFYCRDAICPGSTEMRYLRMKEKILMQYISNETLYKCSLPGSDCRLDNIKTELPKYLHRILNVEYASLKQRNLTTNHLALRKIWGPSFKLRPAGFGADILSWLVLIVILIPILVNLHSVFSYEPEEEPKPLDPSQFKLRDVEMVLMKTFRKKEKEKDRSTFSLVGAVEWEAAKKAERKRDKAQKRRVFRSGTLAAPLDESDLGSVKRKSRDAALLQKTQNETETVGGPSPVVQASLEVTQFEMPLIEGKVQRSNTASSKTQSGGNKTQSSISSKTAKGSLEILQEIITKRKASRETQKKKKRKTNLTEKKKNSTASSHAVTPVTMSTRSKKLRSKRHSSKRTSQK